MTASELVLRGRMRGDLALVERAQETARDAVEWCAIAETLGARHALDRALGLAGADVRVYRNVARIERTRFGDVGAAKRALAAGADALLAHDATTLDWCALADAWRAAGDGDAALHYLEHARACAATVGDWCALGDLGRAEASVRTLGERVAVVHAYDTAQDLERVLANLSAAVPAIASVPDAVAVGQLLEQYEQDPAPAFAAGAALVRKPHEWVSLAGIAPGDDERRRCFERGRRDEQAPRLMVPGELLPWSVRMLGWPHEPAALLDRLRAAIGQATLESMAGADYGMDYPEHLAALEELHRSGGVRHPLQWCPLEVLQLERWAEGDGVDHLARALACTVLCIDGAGPLASHEGNEQTIAVLLHSAIALGTAAVDDAIGLFAALAAADRDPELRAFAELAVILATVWRDATDPRIAPLAIRLRHDEARRREHATHWSNRWLLGLTAYDLRHELWRQLAAAILGPSVGHDPQLTTLADLLR